jgi:hypothetical protein
MASIDGNMFVPDGSNNIFTSIREEVAREVPTLRQMQDDLKKELEDPEISLLRNIRHLSVAELECLDVHSGVFEIPGGTMEGEHLLSQKKRKIHARRSYHYKIGKYESSPYYINFLSDEIVLVPGANDDSVRNQTKRLSLNPKSAFRSWFRMPLYKVESLAAQLVNEEIISLSHHCRTLTALRIKSELLVLGALAILSGSTNGFRKLPLLTHICATEHSQFFKKFVKYLFDKQNDYIYLPRNEEELNAVMSRYEEMGLPGAMGSVDVVHVKWSNCPSGDFNRAKGKESYPSLAFECISDFDRRICHVHGPQFGTRNDKHIVKMDEGVASIRKDYSHAEWHYFDEQGNIKKGKGAYLICDNGYLHWPILICPFMRSEGNTPLESCFSANVESVRKDVECCFGILKRQWKSLDSGFHHRKIEVCQHIFVACCVLHNMMLDEMIREDPPPRIGRGCCMPNDGVWLEGPTELEIVDDPTNRILNVLKLKFHQRRNILAHHLWVWKSKCKNGEVVPSVNN